MRAHPFFNTVLLAATLLAPAAGAAEFRSGDTVSAGNIDKDLFIAGGSVGVDGPIKGDVFGAGGSLTLVGPVAEDAMLAGAEVSVAAPVAGDLTAVAASFALDSTIAGDAAIFAFDVKFGRTSQVAGDLTVSGGEITMDGTVNGDLRVAAGRLVLGGTVMGDVDVASGELELRPGARILGDINHAGPDVTDVPTGAEVAGEQKVKVDIDLDGFAEEDSGPTLLGTLGEAIALFLLGVVVHIAFPSLVAGTAADIRDRPGRSFVIGLAAIILTPLFAILVMVTIIGIPVGVLILLLYGAAFPLGLAVAGFGIAELARRPHATPPAFRSGERLKRYAFFILLLTIVGLVPVLGDIAVFCAVAMGMGALLARAMGGRAAYHAA